MNNKLTRGDIEKMREEINYRITVERPRLLEEVKSARAQGDLSENFEYHSAKKEKNRNESRIRFLERMINTASIVDETSADNEVNVNKKVTIYIPDDDEEETYIFVSTMRQDSLSGLISIESPMGRALLHHKVGDTVHIRVSADFSYPVVIRKVEATDEGENASLLSY